MAEPGEPVLWSLYVYAPNKAAPLFFAIAYGLSAIFHIWQCYRYKAWHLIGLHPFCAVLFTAGYALRGYQAQDNYLFLLYTKEPLIIFILSQVFIYICPPLLELANYHILGRLFYYAPHCAPLPANRVLATFGGLMALVEALNAVGVALAANPSGQPVTQSLGKNLTIAAIAIQVIVIVIFVCLAGLFHARFKFKFFAGGSGDRSNANSKTSVVRTLLFALYASMALIFARCVFRLVEHTGHTKLDLNDLDVQRGLSPLLRYEAYFLVFESSLMLVNSWLWNVWHPGRFLPRDIHVFLGEDGVEVEGDRHEDSRPLLAKTAHVLTFGILFRDKSRGRAHQYRGMQHEMSDCAPATASGQSA
ncbi:hypothetical protein N658DRAFT_454173 [Parathielavia hyrcaniae]|uniref:RTA1 domain-containing protein n=1 Tax=Parathielavia hyrcaniae TaxID=113614 RepID=A0AAN6PW28_9PEZI|nr:hypothetical protein N658DRAFT_454173 [Parathielavia hyrcaniae]